MSRRVVVTGLGAITPIGNSVEEFWEGLCEGRTGIGPITYFDTAEYKVKLAAELKDFKPGDYMDVKSARRMEPFSQYAVAAAKQALDDCGIDLSAEDPYRIGVSVGSGIGSLQAVESAEKRLLEKGPGRVDPLLVPRMICNMAAGNIAIQFGLKGKNITSLQMRIPGPPPGPSIRTGTASSWEKALASSCWRSWSTQRQGAQRSMQSFWDTAPPVTLTISPLLQRTAPAQPRPWSLP